MGALDVTDAASARAAVEEVLARHGGIGGLVNNAGYGEYGPLEEVSLDAARRQFEALGMTGWIRRADELHARLR